MIYTITNESNRNNKIKFKKQSKSDNDDDDDDDNCQSLASVSRSHDNCCYGNNADPVVTMTMLMTFTVQL